MSSGFDLNMQANLNAFKAKFDAAAKALDAAILERLKAESEIERIAANHEFGQIQASKIEEAFRKAVQEWYDSYSPSRYGRGGGLFDVLNMTFDAEGLVVDEPVDALYNTGAAIGDGRQGGLFQQVFVEGRHGGGKNNHRLRYPHPYYSHAGRLAVQTESADKIFRSDMSGISAELDNEYETIHRARQAEAVARVQAMIPSLQAQFFSF